MTHSRRAAALVAVGEEFVQHHPEAPHVRLAGEDVVRQRLGGVPAGGTGAWSERRVTREGRGQTGKGRLASARLVWGVVKLGLGKAASIGLWAWPRGAWLQEELFAVGEGRAREVELGLGLRGVFSVGVRSGVSASHQKMGLWPGSRTT